MGADVAVAVALGANPPTKQLAGEPHLSAAASAVVTEVAAEFARVAPAHELEILLACAACRGVAAREVERARPVQPASVALAFPRRLHSASGKKETLNNES